MQHDRQPDDPQNPDAPPDPGALIQPEPMPGNIQFQPVVFNGEPWVRQRWVSIAGISFIFWRPQSAIAAGQALLTIGQRILAEPVPGIIIPGVNIPQDLNGPSNPH